MANSFRIKDIIVGLIVLIAIIIAADNTIFIGFHPSSDHAKVSRARSEIRNISVGLEAYFSEYHFYPLPVDSKGTVVPLDDSRKAAEGYAPLSLTTPVVFLATLPNDPFGPKKKRGQDPFVGAYRYAVSPERGWVMSSLGPDKDYDMRLIDYVSSGENGCYLDLKSWLSHMGGSAVEYDPTNGTISNGDVYRVGP